MVIIFLSYWDHFDNDVVPIRTETVRKQTETVSKYSIRLRAGWVRPMPVRIYGPYSLCEF